MRKAIIIILCFCLLFAARSLYAAAEGWQRGGNFHLQNTGGRTLFIDPDGRPFFSRSVIYSYGPQSPKYRKELTKAEVLNDLSLIKESGFNTVSIAADGPFLDDILQWCEKNRLAVYLRLRLTEDEIPDLMDINFREGLKTRFRGFLQKTRGFHCILALAIDQPLLQFRDFDASGKKRPSIPRPGEKTLIYLPQWLQKKYTDIRRMNDLWTKRYLLHADLLTDKDIVQKWDIKNLGYEPWRWDVIEYLQWSVNDFLRNFVSYVKSIDSGHLVTYTTEMPELTLAPVSTVGNCGIDFISRNHYNQSADYGRDWISAAQLIFESKFQSDLNNMPVYLSASGFRTQPLAQEPAHMTYAASRPGDKNHQAELYLMENMLVPALPFISGWAYNAWHDIWLEGDFGYINDDGSIKPVSELGDLVNSNFPAVKGTERPPRLWLYYPRYAFGSPRGSFQQYKTLVSLLECDFLSAYNTVCNELAGAMAHPEDFLKKEFFTKVSKAFAEHWFPFKFTAELPENDRLPVLLAGNALEQLSESDRKTLLEKRTLTMGEIGLRDENLHSRDPWYLEAADVTPREYTPVNVPLDLAQYIGTGLKTGQQKCKYWDCDFTTYRDGSGAARYLRCTGQEITLTPAIYTALDFLIASSGDDACEQVTLKYSDGTSEKSIIGPTIPTWREKPAYGHLALTENIGSQPAYLTHFCIPCNPMKQLRAIALPRNSEICIFAVSGNHYGVVRSCTVSLQYKNMKLTGKTPWMVLLNPVAGANYRVLASFENGYPAIIQSRNGRHIAFLYDGLTWEGKENELSLDTATQAEILKQVLKKL